jgi:4-amino-4-deoxy-L-arabinose transferase-like glycosyltransferase
MNLTNIRLSNNWLYVLIAIAALVNFSGLFITIIGPDGTLYASIAKTMVLKNNYIELFDHGTDWLDKPHFPFWVTAFSFKIFGFNTWAYKLPGILFFMMGAVYTYLFAKNLYGKQTALWSVLILLTAQHIVLSNTDVRAEPYLTGLIIAAVFHLYLANKKNSYLQLIIGCLFTACAIMTKGMFALVPIAGAVAGHLIITKEWRQLLNIKWLLGFLLILIFIVPELYCLYYQFDAHPEKMIFGTHGVSGIKFFFWDSQFGRFFNTGPIKGHGDPTFFVHTLLWAFLPWSLLLFCAIYHFIKSGVKSVKTYEWYCISASLLTFLLFSASKFQLPHYLNIVFPFFAIITAQYLNKNWLPKSIRIANIIQIIVISLMLLVIVLLTFFFQPEALNWFVGGLLIGLLLVLLFLPNKLTSIPIEKIFIASIIASFIVNLFLNLAFYPSLMKYQAASEAAIWINRNNKNNLPVAEFEEQYTSAFDFYINKQAFKIDLNNNNLPTQPFILYAEEGAVNKLKTKGYKVKNLKLFSRYWVSRLKPAFLNKQTRVKELTTTQVVLVN